MSQTIYIDFRGYCAVSEWLNPFYWVILKGMDLKINLEFSFLNVVSSSSNQSNYFNFQNNNAARFDQSWPNSTRYSKKQKIEYCRAGAVQYSTVVLSTSCPCFSLVGFPSQELQIFLCIFYFLFISPHSLNNKINKIRTVMAELKTRTRCSSRASEW